ncbi:fimbrillin family protein [Butyricimonas sp. Marseille-P3923]|uniref:fimbrillin family protein n=1 Tax=Butyricimonas sp. Marseille-P3923 TaxID=1987504 RepID=UPI000C06BE9E|nr:fimbrillin family protein [Butyricimonas sp. Marseille-P3923]
MKIIKKNICLIAILSGVVGLSACSRDDVPAPDGGMDDGNAIRFTTAIADFMGSDAADDPDTRAIINDEDGTGSFDAGDETTIRGFIFNSTPFVEKEYPATYKDGTWTTGMTWDEFDEGAEVSFSAFFPKRSLTDFDENGKMEINLPTDQSALEQYAAYDWLYAAAAGTKTDNPIQLTFRHLMHRLTVNLSLSDTPGSLTQADVDAATVVIKNMYAKGLVAKNGAVVAWTIVDVEDFTPLESAGNTFRVILLPQNVTPGTPWIEITVGGKTVTYPVPDGLTELQGGKEQVVNLALTNSGVN